MNPNTNNQGVSGGNTVNQTNNVVTNTSGNAVPNQGAMNSNVVSTPSNNVGVTQGTQNVVSNTVNNQVATNNVAQTQVPVNNVVNPVNNVNTAATVNPVNATNAAVGVTANAVGVTPSVQMPTNQVAPNTNAVTQPPVDNGIREEVKLDTSVAMEGVPTVNNMNETAPTQENEGINAMSVQTEVNTQKSKTSNVIVIIILLIIAGCIFFIDDITEFFNQTVLPIIKNEPVSNDSNGNLVDGYIRLGDSSSFMKLDGIRFYNFTTGEQNKIIFSYVSDKKLDSTSELGYYIVFYNNDKEITYKELFSAENKVESGEVNQYKINVDADVYQDSKYGKIIKYTTEELQKKYKITCTYEREDEDNIKLRYENIYNFENDMLIAYSITKEYTLPEEETVTSKKYKDELDNENTKISGIGIKTDYKDNRLFYSVSLNSLPEGFIPLYKSGATKTMIIKKENLKKWECK